jgi:hypothetical protein
VKTTPVFLIFLILCLAVAAVISPVRGSETPFGPRTAVHFASVSEGQNVLTTKDEFVRHLSPFDRASRMKTNKPVSEDEYLAFVGRNVVEWTAEEMRAVEAALKEIQSRFGELSPAFPATIQMIKTTGAEEGNAAYTRGTAIILPKGELGKSQDELVKLICHELFHVLSRHDSELRAALYGMIGFERCDDLEFPPELAARKITNPDGPRNDHFIRLEIDGQKCGAIPVLFSKTETYNVARGGEFFEYLDFQFLIVEVELSPRPKVVYDGSKPKLVGPQAVSGFLERVGKNTQYLIHPDEILAENFALLILSPQNVPSPEVLQKMKTVLARKPKG